MAVAVTVGVAAVAAAAAVAEVEDDTEDDREGLAGSDALSCRSSSFDNRLSSPAFLPCGGGGYVVVVGGGVGDVGVSV